MANKIVTFTTYKTDGSTLSGTPFVFGFVDKAGNNNFDNTATDPADADLEIPPPPPPGDGAGNPISTSYIDSMYVKVSDGTNDINAYQYFIDSSDNSDISLNLAVRDYTADDVVFKYDVNDVSGVFTTLAITNENITNGGWTIDLVGASVSGTDGSNPSVTENGDVRTVTLPHLGNNNFYTMNLKQYVADSGPTRDRGDVNNDTFIGVADVVFLASYLAGLSAQTTAAANDPNFNFAADTNLDGAAIGVADVVYLASYLAGLNDFNP